MCRALKRACKARRGGRTCYYNQSRFSRLPRYRAVADFSELGPGLVAESRISTCALRGPIPRRSTFGLCTLKHGFRLYGCQRFSLALVKVIPCASPSTKAIPCRSSAALIAARLFAIGTRRPFSKSRTVERETCAALARSSCDRSNQARAARHCSGVMPL